MSDQSLKRKFSREFKTEAVRLVTDGGRTVSDVARSLGIHENSLYRWIRDFSADPVNSFPGKGRQAPDEEELRRLQKENNDLREEREILKKALAIFSRHRG